MHCLQSLGVYDDRWKSDIAAQPQHCSLTESTPLYLPMIAYSHDHCPNPEFQVIPTSGNERSRPTPYLLPMGGRLMHLPQGEGAQKPDIIRRIARTRKDLPGKENISVPIG
jgi:hypothetical protein